MRTGGLRNSCLAFSIVFLLAISLVSSEEYVKNATITKDEDALFVYQTFRYPAQIEIVEANTTGMKVGISGDTWRLDFGKIYETMGVKKYISLVNPEENEYKIKMSSIGNISQLVSFGKNNFIVEKGTSMNISVSVKGTASGNYTGEVVATLKRFKYHFFDWLLRWI